MSLAERKMLLPGLSEELAPERKEEILISVGREARGIFEEMPILPIHDITHVERVVANAKLICEGEIIGHNT